MSVDALLARLHGVRQVGVGCWRALCSAHDGKNRNALSIREGVDGIVWVKCWYGCTAAEIVGSVGLELRDLFPRTDWQQTGKHSARPRRPRVDWPAAILACERDLILVKIVLTAASKREPVADVDALACQTAATRVYALLQEARNG